MPSQETLYTRISTLNGCHSDTIHCLSFSPAGDVLASGSDDGTIALWDIHEGTSLRRFSLGSPVTAIVWHPLRSKSVICGCFDGTVRFFEVFEVCHSFVLFVSHT